MKRNRRFPPRLLSVLLTLCLLASLLASLAIPSWAAPELPPANSQPRHVVCTALSAQAQAYYTGDFSYEALSHLPGAADPTDSWAAAQDNPLYSALKALMTETHVYYSSYSGSSPGSLLYYWNRTDAVNGEDHYHMFYADVDPEGYTLNREHVWPKSRASFYQRYGGADLHHLRPSVSSLNGAKSNHRFGNIVGVYDGYNEGSVGGTVCYWTYGAADLFECKDDVKGDVARILLYVYCRWGQPNLYSDVSADKLPQPDSDDNANNGVRVVESLETLLSWCQSDPVDTWEMERNDLIQQVQGNRNVFIDYPELAWRMFGLTPPAEMTTPSGEASGGKPVAPFTVTAVSGNPAWGTVSPQTQQSTGYCSVTATPTDESKYFAAGYLVTEGSATVWQNGSVFTIRASADCTVTIVFAERTRYAVRYLANGSPYDPGEAYTSVPAGDVLLLPADAPAVEGWTFAGWTSDGSFAEGSAAPQDLILPGGSYTPQSDLSFYAVYRHVSGGSGSETVYEAVGQAADVEEGVYVITWNDELYLPSETAAAKNPPAGTGFAVSEDRITGVTEEMKWDFLGSNSSGFAITHTAADGTTYHLGAYNYSQGLIVDTTGATDGRYYRWTVADNGSVGLGLNCSDGSSRVIWVYTNNSGVSTWRYYLSGGAGTLRLYRETTGEGVERTYSIRPDAGQLPPHEHVYSAVVTAPTCTEQGYTTYTCTCGDSYVDDYVPALDHDWGEATYEWRGDFAEVTATRVCKRDESHVETETVQTSSAVTKPATLEEEGEIIYTAVFENPAFGVQEKAEPIPKLEPPTPVNPFDDVKDSAYYYEPVLWAVNHDPQITNGTGAATFSPEDTCTRGQVVTFLWRAKGCPEPTSTENPFKDVKDTDYFYKAVLWAREQEITNGTDATHFSPNDGCTRAQVVTFLWRAEGSPEATTGENELPIQPAETFADVPADAYYSNAVLWAVEKGITNGTDPGKFSPNATCTRGQIVTFLYRDMA